MGPDRTLPEAPASGRLDRGLRLLLAAREVAPAPPGAGTSQRLVVAPGPLNGGIRIREAESPAAREAATFGSPDISRQSCACRLNCSTSLAMSDVHPFLCQCSNLRLALTLAGWPIRSCLPFFGTTDWWLQKGTPHFLPKGADSPRSVPRYDTVPGADASLDVARCRGHSLTPWSLPSLQGVSPAKGSPHDPWAAPFGVQQQWNAS